MTTYVTVFPYCLKLHSHSVPFTLCATCGGRTAHSQPAPSSCRAVFGWILRRLLGVNVHVLRVSQQANPLLLLPLFRHLENTKEIFSKIIPPVPMLACTSSSAKYAGSLSASIRSFISLWRNYQTLHKLCTLLNWKAFEILPASSFTLLRLLTKAAEYKPLILKLSQKKSEIRQSAWVITQVLTFIQTGIRMGFC